MKDWKEYRIKELLKIPSVNYEGKKYDFLLFFPSQKEYWQGEKHNCIVVIGGIEEENETKKLERITTYDVLEFDNYIFNSSNSGDLRMDCSMKGIFRLWTYNSYKKFMIKKINGITLVDYYGGKNARGYRFY